VQLPANATPTADLDAAMADALAAEQADLDAQRARTQAEPASTGEGPRQGEFAFDLPNLRRDLFPSDEAHRLAQAQADADALGLPKPVVTAESLAAARTPGEKAQAIVSALEQPGHGFALTPPGSKTVAVFGGATADRVRVGRDGGLEVHNGKSWQAVPESSLDDIARQVATNLTESVSPAGDTPVGVNAAGEALYQRADGQRYRMTARDQKPDFGGDLAPIEQPPGAAVYGAAEPGGPPRMAEGVDTPEGLWAAQRARGFPADPVFGVVGKDGAVTAWEPTYDAASRRAAAEGGSVRELAPEDFGMADPRTNDMSAQLFDDPSGEAARTQAADLTHTVQQALDAGLFEGAAFAALGDTVEHPKLTLARLDGDDAAIAAIKDCL
jgi:hypothetical protein